MSDELDLKLASLGVAPIGSIAPVTMPTLEQQQAETKQQEHSQPALHQMLLEQQQQIVGLQLLAQQSEHVAAFKAAQGITESQRALLLQQQALQQKHLQKLMLQQQEHHLSQQLQAGGKQKQQHQHQQERRRSSSLSSVPSELLRRKPLKQQQPELDFEKGRPYKDYHAWEVENEVLKKNKELDALIDSKVAEMVSAGTSTTASILGEAEIDEDGSLGGGGGGGGLWPSKRKDWELQAMLLLRGDQDEEEEARMRGLTMEHLDSSFSPRLSRLGAPYCWRSWEQNTVLARPSPLVSTWMLEEKAKVSPAAAAWALRERQRGRLVR